MSAWELTHTLAALLVPPGLLLAAAVAAAVLARRRRRAGRALLALTLLAAYALSVPALAYRLLGLLEPAAADPLARGGGQAIVVLGGGRYAAAPEYGGDTVSAGTLERLRYAARLQRASGRPLLVAGGSPDRRPLAEAAAMRATLEADFGVPVAWSEERSRNTLENARFSRALLREAGVSRVYLVTHAWHMPRARLAFEHAGFAVVPAATGYSVPPALSLLAFAPSAQALLASSRFFHEVIGIAWYRLQFLTARAL